MVRASCDGRNGSREVFPNFHQRNYPLPACVQYWICANMVKSLISRSCIQSEVELFNLERELGNFPYLLDGLSKVGLHVYALPKYILLLVLEDLNSLPLVVISTV